MSWAWFSQPYPLPLLSVIRCFSHGSRFRRAQPWSSGTRKTRSRLHVTRSEHSLERCSEVPSGVVEQTAHETPTDFKNTSVGWLVSSVCTSVLLVMLNNLTDQYNIQCASIKRSTLPISHAGQRLLFTTHPVVGLPMKSDCYLHQPINRRVSWQIKFLFHAMWAPKYSNYGAHK